MTDEATNPSPPPEKPIQIRRVSNFRDLKRARLRVINAALAGKIAASVGNCALFGLDGLGREMERELIDARVTALEERAAGTKGKPLQRIGGSHASRH